ncbi:MAG TPA: extracellular solute-binding protein [Jiangellaceae bacterium]|nr:extracellular solute-binding protein [Jiangellaceae bacterium]
MTGFSRRGFLSMAGIGAGAAVLASCSSTSSNASGAGGGGEGFQLPTYQAAPDLDVSPYYTSDTEGMEDVYTEQVSSFFQSVDREPGSGDTVTTFQLTWGDPPKKVEENPYWQELNERLGVSFEPTFAPAPTFDQSFATMLASGEVPDLVFLNDQSAPQLQAIRDGAFADLSEVLAGDNILQWPNLAARQENIWRASLKDGRLYQIPSIVWAITNPVVVRNDLLGQTSVGESPADADELFTALKEVSELGSGPGGQRVYGVSKYESPMWRWIFKTGADWQLDEAGNLVHVAETDNYREMLTWLAQAWAEGIFDPVAMTSNDADIVSGAGLEFRAVTNTFTTADGLAQDEADLPGVEADYFILPGFDGDGPLITRNIPYGRSTVISAAAAEDSDRLTEILNVLDYLSAPYGSEEALFIGAGIEGRHYTFDEHGIPVSTEEHTDELGVQYVAVVSGDNSYRGHPNQEPWKDSFSEALEHMAQHSEARVLEGLESNSETFVRQGAQLTQLWTDFERGVVSGRESVDDLDSFISEYMSRGGEDVRTEYTEALDANS